MQLPISMPGLGHVNAYALVDDRGAAIVDPGMPGPGTWTALTRRLRSAGLSPTDVHTVIITHSHPDHFGSAGRLAEAAGGADVVTHSAFRAWFMPHTHADDEDQEIHDVDPEDMPTGNPWERRQPWGGTSRHPGPRGIRQRMRWRAMRVMGRAAARSRFAPPAPTSRVRNGEVLKLAGREWFAVHTPGHTIDHLCLHDPEGGLLLSGDHVLPTITPHISGLGTGRDPLALFVSSLDSVGALDVATVLPAHGHPFTDLSGRVEAIKRHHRERLDKLREVAAALGPTSVMEYSHHLFRRERWGSMAESETYAHLEHLRLAGDATSHERDGELIYDIHGT
jgi:glyoxylase-like metal-dependent hydrolase (beta-lactamase superfamily II)